MLAAGSAARFGATKQLVEVAGRPLVAHAVAVAREAGVDRVVVVVGHDATAVAEAARAGGDVEVVVNEDFAEGQASSLRAGITQVAADPAIGVLVVLLADQPGVQAPTVRRVVAAVGGEVDAARASYADRPGHPVAFARRVFDRLLRLEGDAGARQILDELAVADIDVPGPVPPDVDTPTDLQRLRG